MTFQWFDGPTALSGATNATLTLHNVSDASAAAYAVVISNSSGSVTSSVATLTVIDPPAITSQPVAQSVNLGGSALFQVTVRGTQPLSFQWFDGSTALPRATNAALSLLNVSNANAGSYSVVVSNGAGRVTSSVAALIVIDPPVITSQPVAQSVALGGSAHFQVAASGTSPFSFQWFDGAATIPAGTAAALQLLNVSNANAGSYTVVVSNSAGRVTSSVAALIVIDPPVITSQPVARSVGVGANVLFQVAASGTSPFSFQWFEGAAPIPAATGAALQLLNVSGANTGNYYAVIQNAAGSVTSASAALAITNAFVRVAGAYNGLFYQTNGGNPAVAVPTAGMLGNCIVGTNGAYSARIYLGGYNYTLTGVLSVTGSDAEAVSRAANSLPSLYVALNLDMTGASEMITGLVSNMSAANPWTAPLLADLATNTQSVPTGNLGMLLPPDSGAPNSPAADGSVLISSTNGAVTLAGDMADETAVSQHVPVSQAGTIPFYSSLYGGSGLVEGWINLAEGVPTGTVTWIRPAGVTNGLPFPLGFTNVLNVCAFYQDLLGIVGWWPFDEGFGSATIDASGQGHNGTLINSPTWTNGIISDAIYFNGAATNCVTAPQPLTSISNLTIMLWARSSSSNANENGTLLENTAYSYGLIYFKGACEFVGDGSASEGACWFGRLPDNGLWHHWAASWSGGTGIFYIDGIARATNSNMTMNPPGATLHIGGPGTSYSGPYSGTIDDVRIYSNVISPATIAQIYTNGLAGRP